MSEPVGKVVLPKSLKNVPNGRVDKKDLVKIKSGGYMHKVAAGAFNALYDEAKKNGFVLKTIGQYRSYEDQLEMFNDRYSLQPTGRVPQVTRKFLKKKWFLKKGKSPSGVPGTSNHGFGLAVDLGLAGPNGKVLSLRGNGKAWSWMCANAPLYGFYLQGPSTKLGKPNPEFEAWHWQYCMGDKLPPAVVAILKAMSENGK